MKPTILFLRPFWDPDITAEQLKVIYRSTKPLGRLIAIRNSTEYTRLRLASDENPWARYGTFLGKLYDFINPPLDIKLIEATDETWQRRAIEQIRSVDAVIVHLAPRKGPDYREFTKMQPSPQVQLGDSLYELVDETGTGQGLLRELEYCKRVNALDKVIVLIPESFYPRVLEALRILEMSKGGTFFRKTRGGRLVLTPRLSALDDALTVLKEVPFVVPYHKFGGLAFNFHLRRALLSRIASSQQTHTTASFPEFPVDIPSGPVALPPDGKLKHIRFSPIQSLVKIPAGEIVELSFDEVKGLYPELAHEPLECPRCHRKSDTMFWYQYGLEPNLSKDTGIYMSCQYCGHDDYL
jgi:hypothetical protein